MNRIERTFRRLRQGGKKAFIAFITAGYPDLETTEKLIVAFEEIGVDIIELGIPFSDPMADGPIIQEASQEALKKGVHLADVVKLVKRVRRRVEVPICFMTYYNPVLCFGEKRFIAAASEAGVDGIIIPDLPPEEALSLISQARPNNLDTIFFIAPTTDVKRVRSIAAASRGFIYYVSLTGVTGLREALPEDLIRNLEAIKKRTNKPVCVGFGIGSPAHVRQAARFSDGVIVGSAIVKKIRQNIGSPNLVKNVSRFVARLKNV